MPKKRGQSHPRPAQARWPEICNELASASSVPRARACWMWWRTKRICGRHWAQPRSTWSWRNCSKLRGRHPPAAASAALRLVCQTGGGVEVGEQALADNLRLYVGLRDLVRQNNLDAYCVRCWPEMRNQHKITPCAAHALMSQDGIPNSCEVDLPALITTYILNRLAGTLVFNFDITALLAQEGETVRPSAAPPRLSSRKIRKRAASSAHAHRNRRDRGVPVQGGRGNAGKTPASPQRRPAPVCRTGPGNSVGPRCARGASPPSGRNHRPRRSWTRCCGRLLSITSLWYMATGLPSWSTSANLQNVQYIS